jgi:putative nucleotidyltransferase with HDIG domain
MRPFRIRDPIHKFIELDPDERKAIDARCFQRLRSIKQLAMTFLVYPGTEHTRFEHSLGVRELARRLASELGLEDEQKRIVRAAALLHDIGHGPFSHVSENVLDDRNGLSGVHEAISIALIRQDEELRLALGDELCDQAAQLLEDGGRGLRSAMSDIVSGPTDADKLDYLRRDSYYAGVSYGEYDLNRLLDTATVITAGERETYLGFEEDGVWAVEGLLLARHHMHRQVYGHKTRVATDIMIERAITHGLSDGALDEQAYTVPSTDGQPAPDRSFLAAYLKQTDEHVMQRLLDQNSPTPSRDLAERLVGRRLLRRHARIALHERRDDLGIKLRRILKLSRAELAELEREIAGQVSHPAHLVALYVEQPSNPTYRLPGADINAKDIMLAYKNGTPDYFQRESEVFREGTDSDRSFASLYFPKDTAIDDKRAEELLWSALSGI